MKLTSLKENLKQGLSIVGHLTTKNINLPILNNILFRAKKEGLELISTNLEISIVHFMRSKVDQEGEVAIDSKIINDYVSLLPEEKIEIETVNDELKIKCKNYKTKINTQDSKDFPLVPIIEDENCFYVKTDEFKKAISNVSFAVASSDGRPEISGIFFSLINKNIFLVGTDSYRLAEKSISFSSDKNLDDKKFIVPAKTIQEVIRILNNFKDDEQIENIDKIKICFNENQISFSFGSSFLTSRLIIGSYPDYKQIIPNNKKTEILVNKSEIVRAIKAAGLFSKAGINDIGLSSKKDKLIIFSNSSQVGENFVEIDCKTKGEEMELFINYKYLLEGLNNISDDEILLSFLDKNTPCKIETKKDDKFLYIVMPIRQ